MPRDGKPQSVKSGECYTFMICNNISLWDDDDDDGGGSSLATCVCV